MIISMIEPCKIMKGTANNLGITTMYFENSQTMVASLAFVSIYVNSLLGIYIN